jgi:hypothetical protein
MTCHSDNAKRICLRCGNVVTAKSFFAVHFWSDEGKLFSDIVFTKDVIKNGSLMHVIADRECKGTVSGYIGKLLLSLKLPSDYNTSKLFNL